MIRTKKHVFLFLTVAIFGSLLYFYFDPSLDRIFPPCPFYTFTGLLCPGCGSQRAFHALLHGDVAASAGKNLLFVVFLPFMVFSLVAVVNNIFSTKKIGQAVFSSTLFSRIVLAVVVLFWILRNVPYAPFTMLAP